jgi:hypothetical protein
MMKKGSDDLYLHGIQAFWSFLNFITNCVVFGDVAVNRLDVNEDVLTTSIWSDEAVTFVFVEKLNRSLGHVY